MKILIDENISAARGIFEPHGQVIRKDGRSICHGDLANVDVLIIRSITRVDKELLKNSTVRFVGTTTIGTDHLDIPWLEKNGITWVNAPGCNADAAAQYTLAMIWLACERRGIKLENQRIGIIGRGNVGSRVQKLLTAIGATSVANDPPLADAGEKGLVSLDCALQQDIVCLHVPMTRDGLYPSYRMLNERTLAKMPASSMLVNCARGDVVDGAALKHALEKRRLHAVLDVWPGEPRVDPGLINASLVATPHVAGYSEDGKYNGAIMVYRAFCSWAGQTALFNEGLPATGCELDLKEGTDPLTQAMDASCFVRKHDLKMRELTNFPSQQLALGFETLRRNYPSRRDFQAWRILCARTTDTTVLKKLGFQCTSRI